MEPIAETKSVKAPAQNHFQLGVLPADSGHHPATNTWRDDVSQRPKPLDDLAS
jgi:hypothetical protein